MALTKIGTDSIKDDAVTSAKIPANAVTQSEVNFPVANRNLIINGAQLIAQRGVSSTSSGYHTVDRFQHTGTGWDASMTQSQSDVASGTTPYTLGFRKAFKVTNGSQTRDPAASELAIRYSVEAQDIANSGWNYTSSSSNITLSFWVKSSLPLNFYGYLRSIDGTSQLYPFETGSLSADTWTKVTKTISGNSNLQFDNNNEEGLRIEWRIFQGTNFTDSGVSLNTWAAYASGTRSPDQATTWFSTNNATFEITGVQLEVGSVSTSFEHKSFAQELDLCQRYYQKSYNYSTTPGTATTIGCISNTAYAAINYAGNSVQLPVRMRAAPTVTLYGTSTGSTGKINADSGEGTGQAMYIGEKNFFAHRQDDGTGVGVNVYIRFQYQAVSEL